MKILTFDEIIIKTIGGKTGRFNYFLTLLIVLVGYFYLDTFYFSDRCLVCCPIQDFPWRELIGYFVIMALMGVYLCLLMCKLGAEYSFSIWPLIMPILFTFFFIIQTIKRCHDINRSGWRFLIPFYSPLLLLFLPKEMEEEHPVKTPIWKTVWKSKWLFLLLLSLCFYIYQKNQMYIHMHNAL